MSLPESSLPADSPLGRMMSTDAEEELYKLLLETAHESPLEVVANCVEVLATVLNKRMHDACG